MSLENEGDALRTAPFVKPANCERDSEQRREQATNPKAGDGRDPARARPTAKARTPNMTA
jgi:hypothetical protein